VNNVCDKSSGQCPCRPRISGLKCTSPLQTHYFPTLYQFQYEAEDGTSPSGGQVRIGYDETLFPDYSWRGYAIYSQIQVHILSKRS
jgi:laminin alpha 3/5